MSKDSTASMLSLQEMRSRPPFMTHSALSALIRDIRDRPPGDKLLRSRRKIRESRDFLLEQQGEYGALHKRVALKKRDGTNFILDAVCPFAMLALA